MPRNKGSLNKVTQDTKKVLKTVLEGQIDRIELALDEVYDCNDNLLTDNNEASSIPPSKGQGRHQHTYFTKAI